MADETFTTQGTKIARSNMASPEVFTDIPKCTSITPIGQTRNLIDVTSLDSTAREYKKAIKDGQEINLEIQYNPQNAQHNGLRSDMSSESSRRYRVTLTDDPATVIEFSALCTNWSITDVEVDGVYKLEVTLKPTGDLTFS